MPDDTLIRRLFGCDWAALDIDHVRAFFSELVGEEGVDWEAKGTELIEKAKLAKHACGFANTLGGCLIFGASEVGDGSWKVDGVDVPSAAGEPGLWATQTIRDRLTSAPRTDAKFWPLDGGPRQVGVVVVERTPYPPCLDRGRAYERVVGATVPVRDPLRLQELIHEGADARRDAEADVNDVLVEICFRDNYDMDAPNEFGIALACRADIYAEDLFERVYSPAFRRDLFAACEELYAEPHGGFSRITPAADEHSADGVRLLFQPGSGNVFTDAYGLRVSNRGAVGVGWFPSDVPAHLREEHADQVISRLWRVLVPLVEALGGRGDATLGLSSRGILPSPPPSALLRSGESNVSEPVVRRTGLAALDDATARRLMRGLIRLTGERVYETPDEEVQP